MQIAVKVRRWIAPPPASPERCITVSHYTALQLSSRCQRDSRMMNDVVTMAVQKREVEVIMIVMVAIAVMNF